MIDVIKYRALAGFVAGLLGGLVMGLLITPQLGFILNLLVSIVLGIIFGLAFGSRINTLGAGLVWGQAFGFLWWVIGPLTVIPFVSGQELDWSISSIQLMFPQLLGQVIALGAVLGLSYQILMRIFARYMPEVGSERQAVMLPPPVGQDIVALPIQGTIIGALGGLMGAWVFLWGIETAKFFPLVAGLMGSSSMALGQILHYAIGIIIGVSFGILCHKDIQSAGAGVIWGLNYGLLWWVIGPMTLMPWFLGDGLKPDWSVTTAQANVAPLVAHALYGALVGLFYAVVNKFWDILFVDSDPLNRTREGAGTQGLRAVLMGQAGGLIGGLIFTIIMVSLGALPDIARLIGAQSAFAGFIVHLVIAILIGSSYGLLFRRASHSYGSGLGWGLTYGLLWWLVGAVTLFSLLLRQPIDWSAEAVGALYPALVGHLLYGAGLGLFFQYLAHRYVPISPPGMPNALVRRSMRSTKQLTDTSSSALWAVTLALGIMLPLILGRV